MTPTARRVLDLSGPQAAQVIVTIMQPEPDQDDFRCVYHIAGLGNREIKSYGMGIDSMQALILTLHGIGARLYTSEEFKAGRLTWLGQRNLGFPVPDTIADLVPP